MKSFFKNKFKTIFIITAIAVAFNFFPFFLKNVQAQIVVQQPISTSQSSEFGNVIGQNGITQTLGQLGITDEINSFVLKASTSIATFAAGSASLQECALPDYTVCTQKLDSIVTASGNQNVYINGTGTTFNASSTAYYYLKLFCNGAMQTCSIAGSSNNAYANGQAKSFIPTPFSGEANITPVVDIYFQLGKNITTSSDGSNIGFNFPTEDLVTPDFGNFNIFYEIPATTTPLRNFFGEIRTNSLTPGQTSNFSETFFPDSYSNSSFNVTKNNVLANGDFVSIASLYAIPDTGSLDDINNFYLIASSTALNFSIINTASSSPGWTPPVNGNPTFPIGNEDLCEDVGFTFSKMLQCLGAILFVPSDEAQTKLQNVFNSFSEVFPFSIFFELKDILNQEIEDLTGTVSSPQSFTFDLGFFGSYTLAFDLENILGATAKDSIFTIQGYLIWIATGYIIIRQII